MGTTIGASKYVRFTTKRKDGTPRSTPVWIADLGDGEVGFTTASQSYKVKRIANDPTVVLQPANARGEAKAGSEAVTGHARVATGDEFQRVLAAIKAKYGFQHSAISLLHRLQRALGRGTGPTDCAVIVQLDEGRIDKVGISGSESSSSSPGPDASSATGAAGAAGSAGSTESAGQSESGSGSGGGSGGDGGGGGGGEG